jgi:hypothetical protein
MLHTAPCFGVCSDFVTQLGPLAVCIVDGRSTKVWLPLSYIYIVLCHCLLLLDMSISQVTSYRARFCSNYNIYMQACGECKKYAQNRTLCLEFHGIPT